jgi:hypothetical protein
MHWHLKTVAEAIWPSNPELARQLAARAGTTPEAWGLVPLPALIEAAPALLAAAPASPPFVAPPPMAVPLLAARREHADSIVYDAANAVNLPPLAVQPAVAAAFRRALALGVDLGTLVRLWEPAAEEPKKASPLDAR